MESLQSAEIRLSEDIEKTVREYIESNPDARYIDSSVFNLCFQDIKKWLDVRVLLGFLLKYGLANSNDVEILNSQSHFSDYKRTHLIGMAERGGLHGFMVLYVCIRESRSEALGHKDVIQQLDELAQQRNVEPPWIHQRRTDYRGFSLQSSTLTDQDTITSLPAISHSDSPPLRRDLTPREQLGRTNLQAESVECKTISREVEHYCTSGYKEYKKVNTYHRTSGGANAVNPNPVNTNPQEESASHVPHIDVRHPYLLSSPGMGIGTGNDERDGGRPRGGDESEISNILEVHEEQTRKIHEKNTASLKKSMNLLPNSSNNTCYFTTVPSDHCGDLFTLKCLVGRFAVASLNTRDKMQSSVLIVGMKPPLPEDQCYSPTGLPYLNKNVPEDIFKFLQSSIKTSDEKNQFPFSFEALKAMIKMDVISVLPSEKEAVPSVNVLLVTVAPSIKVCREHVFLQCLDDKTGKLWRQVFRLIHDDVTGTDIVEQDRDKMKRLEMKFKGMMK